MAEMPENRAKLYEAEHSPNPAIIIKTDERIPSTETLQCIYFKAYTGSVANICL